MTRVFPLTEEAHALISVARTGQSLYIRVKASHEDIVPLFIVKFGRLGPQPRSPLLPRFLGLGLNCFILGVDLEGEFHVLDGVFVPVEHLGVAGQDVSCHLHRGCHILWATFEEATASPGEDCIPREDAPIDRSSHLVPLRNLVCRMLHGLCDPLSRLKKVEHVATGMAWRVEASDLDVVGFEDLFVLETLSGPRDVISGATQNLDVGEQLLHLCVALRVIPVLVRGQDMRWLHSYAHFIHELSDLLGLRDINQDTWLRRQISRHIVAQVPHIVQHVDHIDLHIYLSFSQIQSWIIL